MNLIICIVLLLSTDCIISRRISPRGYRENYEHRNLRTRNLGGNEPQPTYLLITTASKIYSMKIPADFDYTDVDARYQQNTKDIIYAEEDLSNSWITDAFYIKSEDLIYVNVYNSSASSSSIFTLKYNKDRNSYDKNVLYEDQRHCLGISYNEKTKKLFWTASKSIMTGNSNGNSATKKVLFELNRAKKLLYLKYDSISDVLYVSTLNYVYECTLANQDFTQSILYTERCRIIARNLVSARGLYLDNVNRYLYVVDHKRRRINRIKLKTGIVKKNVNSHIESAQNSAHTQKYQESRSSLKTSTTFVSQQTMPGMGDVFSICIYNHSNADLLIWSEFSGQIKALRMSDMSSYKILFKTNEYTYSISIMDNRTEILTTQKPITTTTTQISTTTSEIEKTTVSNPVFKEKTTKLYKKQEIKETTQKIDIYNEYSDEKFDYEEDYIMKNKNDEEKELEVTASTSKNEYYKDKPQNVIQLGSRKFIVKNDPLDTNLITASPGNVRTKLNFLRSSNHLSAALYIVICLLCFSLFINIILLYISKMKHNKGKQMIISHEICDIKRCGSATTKSTSESSASESGECNLNLINSSGSATSGLDSDN